VFCGCRQSQHPSTCPQSHPQITLPEHCLLIHVFILGLESLSNTVLAAPYSSAALRGIGPWSPCRRGAARSSTTTTYKYSASGYRWPTDGEENIHTRPRACDSSHPEPNRQLHSTLRLLHMCRARKCFCLRHGGTKCWIRLISPRSAR
jgi:hypothetical protein